VDRFGSFGCVVFFFSDCFVMLFFCFFRSPRVHACLACMRKGKRGLQKGERNI
jgi:hypothetical protein